MDDSEKNQTKTSKVPKSEGPSVKTAFSYSILILVLPLFFFFTTRTLVFECMLGQRATVGTNIVSAVAAVIVLHLALGLFIYKEHFNKDEKQVKVD